MADRTFLLKVIADITGAQKGLGTLESDIGGTKDKVAGYAKAIGGVFAVGAAVEFGKGIVNAASDQEQAIGAVNSVFGEYADTIHGFSETTAKELGVSKGEFEQLSTLTGALLKNAKVPMDEVTDSTMALTERAADLAAMYGGTVPDALAAINSGLKGEMDPLEKFGVSLKASAVDAKAAALGYVDAEGNVTDYGKQMARVALIMEQSTDAQGTFSKESGTMAGQTAILKAQFRDLQADLGQKLMPMVVEFASHLRGLIQFVIDNQSWLIPTVAAIGGIVLAMKAWQLATAVWTTVTEIATGVQWLFNAAMTANPIGLIVIGIMAAVAAFILLYKKVDWFREGVDAAVGAVVDAFEWVLETVEDVYNWVRSNWPLLLAIITGPFGLAVYAIARHWDTIKQGVQNVITDITGFFQGLPQKISDALQWLADKIKWPFQEGANLAREQIQRILDKISGIRQWVSDAFWDLADVIKAPFESAFRAIKNLWNSTVGGFGFSVPSWIPGVGGKAFSIPRMAAGGIVRRPTIALIGEAGPEAVVPLGSGGAGLGSVIINVYALTATSETGRLVYNALREYERSTGKSISSDDGGASRMFAA